MRSGVHGSGRWTRTDRRARILVLAMTELPHKAEGQEYFILLRTPDHSFAKTFIAGGLGLDATIPRLSFGETRCICCNHDAAGAKEGVPLLSGGSYRADPVPAPVC